MGLLVEYECVDARMYKCIERIDHRVVSFFSFLGLCACDVNVVVVCEAL